MRWNQMLTVVSAHNEGMRGDVVIGGLPGVPGSTVLDKREYFQRNLDHLRAMLHNEPRGTPTRPVNFIVPPGDPRAAFGYIIGLPTEYPVMSGSNTMCVATVLLETGMYPMTEPITDLVLEAAVGLVEVRCECRDGKVVSTSFLNQPAFLFHKDARIEVDGYGTLAVDVGFGGMTYAMVDAQSMGFSLGGDEAADLVRVGQLVKAAADEQLDAVHPTVRGVAGITQTEFMGPLQTVDGVLTARNAVVVTPGFLDRCPCGTGTSARLALLHARGELSVGQPFVHESILGTKFTASIEHTTTVGPYDAVRPRVTGQSWITSVQQVGVDPTDPFPTGIILSDKWRHAVAKAR